MCENYIRLHSPWDGFPNNFFIYLFFCRKQNQRKKILKQPLSPRYTFLQCCAFIWWHRLFLFTLFWAIRAVKIVIWHLCEVTGICQSWCLVFWSDYEKKSRGSIDMRCCCRKWKKNTASLWSNQETRLFIYLFYIEWALKRPSEGNFLCSSQWGANLGKQLDWRVFMSEILESKERSSSLVYFRPLRI